MQNSENTIYFNFSYFALRLLGKGLYSNVWTAIAELVANGFDAQASDVKIYINAIDKKHSIVEIFDNGYGMNYNDLAERYVLIGKNKRDDNTLDEKTKNELMGRKGIGKLAALYLSNRYYIISKTSDEISAWFLDASNVSDSDIPRLDRISINDLVIDQKKAWDEFKTGTMIKLVDVDLSYFGEQTLAGLKARLSDFYLLNSLHSNMEVAFITDRGQECIFEKVQKNIAFKNMYAFYNNTETDFAEKLNNSVFFNSNITSISQKPREVIVIPSNNFPNVSGKRRFIKKDGTYTNIELPYCLKGWIGIHASINKEDAVINDPEYLKNKAYRPNQLRLYVRNKLAVENFLDYVKNTQAFGNYIEGEISFDILDDNSLPDIATSNRQGFVEDDERIILLIEILKPIINTLIKERVKIGHQIREEERLYNEEIKKKKEQEIAIEKEARIKAENERNNALAENVKIGEKLSFVSNDLGSEKKRTKLLMTTLSADQIDAAKKLHMAKINANTISKIIEKIVLKYNLQKLNMDNIWNDIKSISFAAERLKVNLNYGLKANFNTQEEKINTDLFNYIKEYCESILSNNSYNIKINVIYKTTAEILFSPQNIAIVLENVLNNSHKANAHNMWLYLGESQNQYTIDIIDDGTDSTWKKVDDLESLFEFGKGFTEIGSGIGLYHVKQIITGMKGNIEINSTRVNGFELNVRIPK